MCGIVGITGLREASPTLVEALRRLEYRGYDSAGIATLVNGRIERRRTEGKIRDLDELVKRDPIAGTTGIGHTRWATHGAPSEANAHPHSDGQVAVVHNGIIENFQALRAELQAQGVAFTSETDTEVVVHLVSRYVRAGLAPLEAAAKAIPHLEGAFALAIVFAGHHGLVVGARRGSPLAVGYGDGEMFLGSDAVALAPLTCRIAYLEDGDLVAITPKGAAVRNAAGKTVDRPVHEVAKLGAELGKGNFPHYMLKEIYEQPTVIGDTLLSYIHYTTGKVQLPKLPFDLAKVPSARVVACGTSFHAGLIARYWFESLARLPVEADVASEFRYRDPP
ncbi:MAG TPA: isomerizing glutamine--fructose-6-phosphate transaminase, partial [Alphaproteobacteria bacterium]|nr:isomerizing glutamine--fructose-6-phosphate transaminase [Alphaproteobacteria bacterium]